MTLGLAPTLLGLAMLTGWIGDPLLARAAWTREHPGKALWAWHSLAITSLGGVCAAAVLLAHDVLEHALLALTNIPKGRLHDAYAGPREVDTAWNLTVLLVMAGGALLTHRTARYRRQAQLRVPRNRDDHPRKLTPFGAVEIWPDEGLQAFAIHPTVRRRARVIVSRALLDSLPENQIEAVLAHEFSHVRRRHHRHLAFAEIISSSVRPLAALRSYSRQVKLLVEMQADDDAASATTPTTVARALVEMSDPRPANLAMNGAETTTRVRRLISTTERGDRDPFATVMASMLMALAATPPIGVIAPLLLA